MRLSRFAVSLAFAASAAHAQLSPVNPDWREADAPPPPAVKLDGLIPLDMPRSGLRFGVDPASVSLGSDSIVRYVVVATGAGGAVNALYEGIRCNTAEFKVYARYNTGSGWTVASDSPWLSLHDARGSRHSSSSHAPERASATANRSATQIVRTCARRWTQFNWPQ
jgi:hypothetical protein